MTIKLNTRYALGDEEFFVVSVTKPGDLPVMGYTDSGTMYEFDLHGRIRVGGGLSMLEELKPYHGFRVDDPVMCRDNVIDSWIRCFFAGVDPDGTPVTWCSGGTKWSSGNSTDHWKMCRKPTIAELQP